MESVWRALANPVRRTILDLLREGPQTTGALVVHFPELSRFAVMQHLKVLEEDELVIPRKDGRRRFNYLNPVPIQEVYDRWVVRYKQPWPEAHVSLRDDLETENRRSEA